MIDELKKRLQNPDSIISFILGLAVVVVIGMLTINYVKSRTIETPTANSEKKIEQGTTEANTSSTYTVAKGDSLWSIAQKTIGSGYNWIDIRDANKLTNANQIEVGQTLMIPAVTKREPGQIANASVEVKRPTDGKYTVKHGDSLWNIAVEVYGTGFRWVEIAKANNLTSPNFIHTGNVLVLP